VSLPAAALGGPTGMTLCSLCHVAPVAGPLVPGERGSHLRKYLSADQRYVIKEIHLADGREFNERVRLYHAVELEAMLASAGIMIEQRFGDYQGARCSDGAPRALLLGRAA